ncbi:hypothetical protein EZV62_010014 [Acer yangbiense]|uniref:SWIM-type domain-containing protein n=1 Tax=Acer yangbiense TaxID=1000413 RepID=A0A5C7I1J5_9ROSI|nr:hypothetical protein EZV62_010014 [Acer yangbiense]
MLEFLEAKCVKGECDGDHISLITLVHTMSEQLSGSSKVPSEEYSVWVQLPWCSDVVEGSPNQPVEELEVVEQIGWCDTEVAMFDYVAFSDGEGTKSGFDEEANDNGHSVGLDGDNGDEENNDYGDGVGVDGDNGDGVGLDGDYGDGVGVDGVGLDGDYRDITKECMDLFEGYKSRSDDEFTSDSDTDQSHVNVYKLLRGVSFKKDGNQIKSSVGQTFANKKVMRDIFREYCARHIYANFRGSYCGDSFKKLFWKASISSNVYDFKAALNDIGQIQPGAKEWRMLMKKFQERKNECDAWRTVLPLRVHAKILKHSKARRQMTIISAGDQEYEIIGQDGTFAVKLRKYSCGCGSWQINGIPCPHAMAAISHNCGKEIYMGMIHPMPDQKMWPEIEADEVLPPPPFQVQPGRPKMQRKKESGEKSKGGRTGTVVCTYCKKAGHNTRTCKEKKKGNKVIWRFIKSTAKEEIKGSPSHSQKLSL